jgi:hypothetical protein
MTASNVKVIKKPFWDSAYAIMEAENIERSFLLHLKRCDDPTAAESLSELFLNLGRLFAQKKIDLGKKIY